MQDQNHNQPQSTNPRRTRRKWLRWLAVLAAVAVLVLVYRLTRPPELVWWRSPPMRHGGHRVALLIPNGWEEVEDVAQGAPPDLMIHRLVPRDRRPVIIQRMFPMKEAKAELIVQVSIDLSLVRFVPVGHEVVESTLGSFLAYRRLVSSKVRTLAAVDYVRSNKPVFDRTHSRICNSLTIE